MGEPASPDIELEFPELNPIHDPVSDDEMEIFYNYMDAALEKSMEIYAQEHRQEPDGIYIKETRRVS